MKLLMHVSRIFLSWSQDISKNSARTLCFSRVSFLPVEVLGFITSKSSRSLHLPCRPALQTSISRPLRALFRIRHGQQHMVLHSLVSLPAQRQEVTSRFQNSRF